jgi:hypothetical protein
VPAELHLAENPFPLHLLFERLERLIDIVITDQNLHLAAYSFLAVWSRPSGPWDNNKPATGFRRGKAVP